MSRNVDKEPVRDEFLVLEVIHITGQSVSLDMRIRTDKNWIYYKGILMENGTSFTLKDGQALTTDDHDWIDMVEILSRGDAG